MEADQSVRDKFSLVQGGGREGLKGGTHLSHEIRFRQKSKECQTATEEHHIVPSITPHLERKWVCAIICICSLYYILFIYFSIMQPLPVVNIK